MTSFEGILPGFDCELFIPEPHELWINHLRANGFDVPMNAQQTLLSEPTRPAEFGISAFLTDHFLAWLDKQNAPWFAHASYLRPHPPYSAPGKWSNLVDVASGTLVIAAKGVPPKATQWCIRVIDTAKQASNESCAALSQGPDTEAPDVIALGGDLTTLAYRVLDNSGRAREEIFVGFMNEMVQTVNVPMHAARGQLTQVPWIPDAKILNGIKAGRPVLMCVVAIDPAGNRSDEAPDAAPECATVSPTVAGS